MYRLMKRSFSVSLVWNPNFLSLRSIFVLCGDACSIPPATVFSLSLSSCPLPIWSDDVDDVNMKRVCWWVAHTWAPRGLDSYERFQSWYEETWTRNRNVPSERCNTGAGGEEEDLMRVKGGRELLPHVFQCWKCWWWSEEIIFFYDLVIPSHGRSTSVLIGSERASNLSTFIVYVGRIRMIMMRMIMMRTIMMLLLMIIKQHLIDHHKDSSCHPTTCSRGEQDDETKTWVEDYREYPVMIHPHHISSRKSN